MAQQPPSNYCGTTEIQPFPEDRSFDIEIDTTTNYLDDLPIEIDSNGAAFGSRAASQDLFTEEFDGFSIIDNCLSEASCTELDDPCPFAVPGLVDFEIEHAIVRTAALFKTTWSEIPSCIIADA